MSLEKAKKEKEKKGKKEREKKSRIWLVHARSTSFTIPVWKEPFYPLWDNKVANDGCHWPTRDPNRGMLPWMEEPA
jgi:hypothetical protein